jgi:AcrR family transcriptional regulator
MLPGMANHSRALAPADASPEPSSNSPHPAAAVVGIEQLAADVVVEVVPRRPTPEERAAQRREEIIDAAARVFASKGYYAAGISDIASDLGVAHGTLYRYFNSKQEIADRLLDRVLQLLAQTLLQEDPTASDTLADFRAQMIRIINGVFDLYERNPDHMRFFQHQSMTIDAERIGAALDSFTDFIERFIANGAEKRFFRDDLDIEVMAQSFVGVMFDILRRMLRSPDAAELRNRWIAHGPTAMLDGIASR